MVMVSSPRHRIPRTWALSLYLSPLKPTFDHIGNLTPPIAYLSYHPEWSFPTVTRVRWMGEPGCKGRGGLMGFGTTRMGMGELDWTGIGYIYKGS